MKKEFVAYWLFTSGIFLLVLKSMGAYFLWNVSIGPMSLLVTLLGLVYAKTRKQLYSSRHFIYAFIFLVLYSIWDRDIMSQINIGNIMPCVPILLVLMMPAKDKKTLLTFCSCGLAFISGISLIVFILLFFTELPNAGIISDDLAENYTYTNYIVLLKGAFYDIRFNAIFREPGHLAMIASYFLFANRYDMKKWYNIVLLIVIGFTLSLAGYVLTIVGYLFNLLLAGRFTKVFKKLIPYIVIMIIAVVGIMSYNRGNNFVNELIIARLEYDEDKGVQGNNRVNDYTDSYFRNMINDGSFIIGIGHDKQSHLASIGKVTGAGYKIHIIARGLIGTILIFMFYYVLAKNSPYRQFAFFMLLLYCLSFWQRAYPSWPAWIIPFITSIYIYRPQTALRQQNYNVLGRGRLA